MEREFRLEFQKMNSSWGAEVRGVSGKGTDEYVYVRCIWDKACGEKRETIGIEKFPMYLCVCV